VYQLEVQIFVELVSFGLCVFIFSQGGLYFDVKCTEKKTEYKQKKYMRSCINNKIVDSPHVTQAHTSYPIVSNINGLIMDDEADYLIDIAHQQGLQRSNVIDSAGNSATHSGRTSSTGYIPKGHDKVVQCIEQRIATVSGMPVTHLEPLQLTQYKVGQKYDAHHDYFNKKESGERTTTVFTYLKGLSSNCGGATAFPSLKGSDGDTLKITPRSGCAAMWSNRTLTGDVEPLTLHGGEPVTCNETKVGLNAWFRDTPWV